MTNLNIIDILANDENAAIELALDPDSRAKLREIRAYIEHDEELVGMDVHEFENLSAEEISRLSGRHLDPDLAAMRSAEIVGHDRPSGRRSPPLATLALAMVATFCAAGVIFFMSHMPPNAKNMGVGPVVSSDVEVIEPDRVALMFSGLGSPVVFDLTGLPMVFSDPLPILPEQVAVPPLPSFSEGFSALRAVAEGWTVETSDDFALRALLDTFGLQNSSAVDMSVADNGWVASINDLEWRTTLFSFEIRAQYFSPYSAAPAAGLSRNQSHVLTQALAATDLVDETLLPPGTNIFGMLVSRPNEMTYPLIWVELRNELVPVQTCLDGIPELGGFLSGFSDVGACGERVETPSVSPVGHFNGTASLQLSDVSAASFVPTVVRASMCSGESC